jgi:hypothetical protein
MDYVYLLVGSRSFTGPPPSFSDAAPVGLQPQIVSSSTMTS